MGAKWCSEEGRNNDFDEAIDINRYRNKALLKSALRPTRRVTISEAAVEESDSEGKESDDSKSEESESEDEENEENENKENEIQKDEKKRVWLYSY